MAQFSAEGNLDLQSHYADPARGRGTLVATDRGLRWDIPKLLRARTDGAKWMEMHTFGRSQGTLNIVWTKRDYMNGEFDSTMGGALLFEGSADDAESITNIAILYLDGSASIGWINGSERSEAGPLLHGDGPRLFQAALRCVLGH